MLGPCSDPFLRPSVTSLHVDRRVGFPLVGYPRLPAAFDPRYLQNITHLSFEDLVVPEMHTAILGNLLPELKSLQYGLDFAGGRGQETQNLWELCSTKGIRIQALDSKADSVLCQCQQLQL